MHILYSIKELFSSNYFVFLYAFILLFSFFQGKILSWYCEKKIKEDLELENKIAENLNKDMTSTHEIIEELKASLIEKVNLKETMREYYDCVWKYNIYLLLGIGSFSQLILLLFKPGSDRVSVNLSMLTMTISFIEYRDNRIISKKIDNEVKNKTEMMVSELLDLRTIAIEEYISNITIK